MHWIKRFIHFTGKRHPATLGEAEVTAFLNHLAAERHVAAATQNQALSALLFLFKEVLGRELGWLDALKRPTRPPRLPTVLTRSEVERLLAQLVGIRWLMASLLYGSGLRVIDCLRLRAKTSICPTGRFSSATARARRIASPCCPRNWWSRCVRIWSGRDHRAGASRPLGCVHDHELYPRPEQGRARREKPTRYGQ